MRYLPLLRQRFTARTPGACCPRSSARGYPHDRAEGAAAVPDLVGRGLTADRLGVRFVGDITYIHTWQNFLYLATVIDCYSKKVVGWPIADHVRTGLVANALKNAAGTTHLEPDAIWHSDRSSKYTSAAFRTLVTGVGMRSSMGRTGVCWDNAMARSFFSALKSGFTGSATPPNPKQNAKTTSSAVRHRGSSSVSAPLLRQPSWHPSRRPSRRAGPPSRAVPLLFPGG